jgi:glycosyltransferase involved in cell wall biosynthesis
LEAAFTEAKRLFLADDLAHANILIDGFAHKLAATCNVLIHGDRAVKPAASVIVVSHRMSEIVPAAIQAIAAQCSGPQWEVILVDNGNAELFDIGKRSLSAFVGVTPSFPLGCSGGRNAGAAHATSEIILFLDDDGIMEPGCANSLVSCLTETGAVAVRGKVLPLTTRSSPHYDLGAERIPSFIDCEGVSAWRRDAFLESGGFHPLLAGHEGIELCARLWRHHGPLAFVYEPSAVLRHDYASSSAATVDKIKSYARNRALVEFGGEAPFDVHRGIQEIADNGRQLYFSISALRSPPPTGGAPVSIITTARNARAFVEDYSAGWKRQTQADFQLVYVDDGSDDGTAEAIRTLWAGDGRLTLVERPGRGRGAALNTALKAARHDICIIADADDIPIPSRIARTADFFTSNPSDDFVSFVVFTEVNMFRIGPPSPMISDMSFRSLFDMPAAFPTFAFRKHRFAEPFDEVLQGGVDCDWLRRNMAAAAVAGKLVPYPLVYYRRHSGQITARHNASQRQVRSKLIEFSFSRLLGPLGEEDRRFVQILIDTRKAAFSERRRLGEWVMQVIRANDRLNIYPKDLFSRTIVERFDQVKIPPVVANELQSLRQDAERHIETGNYATARKLLRKALRLRDDPAISARLLAANRFAIVRALARWHFRG